MAYVLRLTHVDVSMLSNCIRWCKAKQQEDKQIHSIRS